MILQTPFYTKHLEAGAKLIPPERMGGWQLPGVYSSPDEEYQMVRNRAGFIDMTLQGEWAITGRDALAFVQKMLVSDVRKIAPGKVIYSTIVNESGNVVFDTTLFWVEENHFILNVARTHGVYELLRKYTPGFDVYITRVPYAMLAFQGPKSREVLQKAVDVRDLPYFSFKQTSIRDIPALIARAGFTGELGYEFYIYPEYGPALWDTLIELGKEFDVRPFGFRALFPLALEKGYLYDMDISEGASPLELGLEWTVGFNKGNFVGKEALLQRKREGLKTKLIGFEVADPKVIASHGDNLLKEGRAVGKVTSATFGPAIGKSLGRASVEFELARVGEELELEHKGERAKVKLARRQFYDPENKRIKA